MVMKRILLFLFVGIWAVSCSESESSGEADLVRQVVMSSEAQEFIAGDAVTVSAEGFADGDQIMFEIRWTEGSGNFAPEGYAKGVRGIVTSRTATQLTFLAPGHYPASTVRVILFRGGLIQTLGSIRVAEGLPETGLYGLVPTPAGTTSMVRIDPATGEAIPCYTLQETEPLHSAVSASGSGILSGLTHDGRGAAFDLTMNHYQDLDGVELLTLCSIKGNDVAGFAYSEEFDMLHIVGNSRYSWRLPEGVTPAMIDACPAATTSDLLLLGLRLPDGRRAPLLLSVQGGSQAGYALTADALLPFWCITPTAETSETYKLAGGYAVSVGGRTRLQLYDAAANDFSETLAEVPGTVLSIAVLNDASQVPELYLLCENEGVRAIHVYNCLTGAVRTLPAAVDCSEIVGVQ